MSVKTLAASFLSAFTQANFWVCLQGLRFVGSTSVRAWLVSMYLLQVCLPVDAPCS